MRRMVVVGAGNVGSAVAFAGALRGLADELVLLDKRAPRAAAEALDMMCSLPRLGAPGLVRAGSYGDCAEAEVVVLCCAAPVRLGQTRNDMFLKNASILADVVSASEEAGFRGTYVVVSNPVDLLAHHLVSALGIARERVLGTGTLLDSLRLEDCLRERYHASEVCALALGEHGEGLLVDWAHTLVDGSLVPEADREDLRRRTIDAAYDIMKGKGSTSYGIAFCVTQVLDARHARDGRVLPLSLELGGELGIRGVTVSVPAHFDASCTPRPVEGLLGAAELSALGDVARAMREDYVNLAEGLAS